MARGIRAKPIAGLAAVVVLLAALASLWLREQAPTAEPSGDSAAHSAAPRDAPTALDPPAVPSDRESIANGLESPSAAATHPGLPAESPQGPEASCTLRLRVVDPEGAPVPGARVDLRARIGVRDARQDLTIEGRAGDDGVFRSPYSTARALPVTAWVAHPSGAGEIAHQRVLPADPGSTIDLGDLATGGERAVTVWVFATDGTPIEGAQLMDAKTDAMPSRTDADGRVSVTMALDRSALRIEAVGFESTLLPVSSDVVDLTVALARVTLLEFLPPFGGWDVSGFGVRVSSEVKLFAEPMKRGPRTLLTDGALAIDFSGMRATVVSSPKGGWLLANVRPGIELEAEFLLGRASVSVPMAIPALRPGEHRQVGWSADLGPQSLRVRVLKPDRTSASRATVRAAISSAWLHEQHLGQGATADAEGVALLTPLLVQHCTLVIESEEAPTSVVPWVDTTQSEVTVVLDVPRRVEVEVIGADGNASDPETTVYADLAGGLLVTAEQDAAGRWIFDRLPPGEVVIHASRVFEQVSQLHDTSTPSARLVLGHTGEVEVQVHLPGETTSRSWSVNIAPRGHARALTREGLRVRDSKAQCSFSSLAFDAYDVWLERHNNQAPWAWERVGTAVQARLDTEHPRTLVVLDAR